MQSLHQEGHYNGITDYSEYTLSPDAVKATLAGSSRSTANTAPWWASSLLTRRSGECPISLPAVEEDALLDLIKICKW